MQTCFYRTWMFPQIYAGHRIYLWPQKMTLTLNLGAIRIPSCTTSWQEVFIGSFKRFSTFNSELRATQIRVMDEQMDRRQSGGGHKKAKPSNLDAIFWSCVSLGQFVLVEAAGGVSEECGIDGLPTGREETPLCCLQGKQMML